jgi:hypothetical protein
MVDITNLQFASSPNSFYSLMNMQETITIYTNEYIDLNGKFLTIGEDINNFYLAISLELQGFKLKTKTAKKQIFYGKIVLVNIQKYLDNLVNNANEAPIINIVAGKVNETIKVPKIKTKEARQLQDLSIDNFEEVDYIIPQVKYVELMLPNPAVGIGGM